MGGLEGYGSFLDDVTRWCSDFFFSPFMHIEHDEVKKKNHRNVRVQRLLHLGLWDPVVEEENRPPNVVL